MNRLLDSEMEQHQETADREISLGVGTILGIFFAIAMMCAVFFGFGYTLGRKSAQTAAVAPAEAPSVAPPAVSSATAKPAAGSPAVRPSSADGMPGVPAPAESAVVQPLPPSRGAATSADGMIVGDKFPGAPSQPAAGVPSVSAAGAFMVQIAAVSTQEIADIELAALRKNGYNVAIHHEPQDQLLHIQIGPFATRKDAEAMRDNVEAHGFNAIVK